jgi:hypothetical protein
MRKIVREETDNGEKSVTLNLNWTIVAPDRRGIKEMLYREKAMIQGMFVESLQTAGVVQTAIRENQ